MATDINQTIQDGRRAAKSFMDAAQKKAQERKARRARFSTGGNGPADDFLRAARRNEARQARVKAKGEPSDFDLADRIAYMPDDEFEKAMAAGEFTPEQLRRAAEYEHDVYMGDVWVEDADNDLMPEPTFDVFMSNPERFGYRHGVNEETDRIFDRYLKYGPDKRQ